MFCVDMGKLTNLYQLEKVDLLISRMMICLRSMKRLILSYTVYVISS